jgi:DNA-binding XRE family transcriptional regulator
MKSINSSAHVTRLTPECGSTSIRGSTESPRSTGAITFGEAVRRERLRRKLSQRELASAVGISEQTVNNVEARRYSTTLATAAALAIYLELPSDTLLTP